MNDLDNIIFFSLLLKIEKKTFSFRLEIRCHSEKEKTSDTTFRWGMDEDLGFNIRDDEPL